MSASTITRRAPGSLAERFWSIARSTGPAGDDTTNPEPEAVVRHVLCILDALSAGEVGDELSTATVSFLQMLRQQEHAGDLSYASPEQARGESLDERSLVFSVGVLLFEELTGRHPFGAMASGRRFARIQKCELGSGVQYFPKVPSQLRNVLMKAMGPFPEERFRSLADLRDQLERFVEGRPEEDPPTKAPRRPLRGLSPSPLDIAYASMQDAPTVVRPASSMPVLSSAPPPSPVPGKASPSGTLRAVSVLRQPTFTPAVPTAQAAAAAAPKAGARVAQARSNDVTLVVNNSGPVHNSTDRVAAVTQVPRTFAVLERVAYVACGMLLALVAAYVALKPKAAPVPAAAIAAPSPVGVGGNAAVATPGAPVRNVDPPALAQSEPEPITFDPELAGRNAAKKARDCFSPDRASHPLVFGVGLLWPVHEAMSTRTFLAPDELQPEERACMVKALIGVSGGAAPTKSTIVEYRFRLRPDGTADIRASVQK